MAIDHETKNENKLIRPKLYVVKFLNDDFTPMEFVVAVMTRIFKMSLDEAEKKTMEVHLKGHAIHGPMTREIAETRISQAAQWARANDLPFRCDLQEA